LLLVEVGTVLTLFIAVGSLVRAITWEDFAYLKGFVRRG
jgi:hypothetical protein